MLQRTLHVHQIKGEQRHLKVRVRVRLRVRGARRVEERRLRVRLRVRGARGEISVASGSGLKERVGERSVASG